MKMNFKKFVFPFLALLFAFVFAGCNREADTVLEEAKNTIILGSEISNLINDLELPAKIVVGDKEVTVSWSVPENQFLKIEPDENGKVFAKVTRPVAGSSQAEIKLTATLSYDNSTTTREWTVYVKPMPEASKVDTLGARSAIINDILEITAKVSYVLDKGFMVHDENGGFYIYMNATPSSNIKPGAEVTVTGTRAVYYSMPQMATPTAVVKTEAPTSGFDYSTAEEDTIRNVVNASSGNIHNYAKMVTVTGKVQKHTDHPVSDYSLLDTKNNSTLYIYDSSNAAVKTELDEKVGKFVSMTIITYDFHSTLLVWRCLGVAGTIEEVTEPVYTDEDKVEGAIEQITDAFDGKTFVSNLNLIATGISGASITWSSSNTDVVANNGKITFPEEDTDVVLTATVTSGSVTETVDITVTVSPLEKMDISEVIEAVDKKQDGIDYVLIEGIIIGTDSSGYYYLADETGVIYVREKIGSLVVGNKVSVIGKVTVYKGSGNVQYSRQVAGNYTVTKLDEEIHECPLPAELIEITDLDFAITKENAGTEVPKEELYGSKLVKVQGYVSIQGDYNDVYISDNADGSAPKILIYYTSKDLAYLKEIAGKEITLTAVIYDYHATNGWRLQFLAREGDVEVTLTDQEKLDFAKDEIEKIVKEGDSVTDDLNFLTETKNYLLGNAKFTWTTDDLATLDAEGVFTAPEADKAVKITVKCFLDGNIEGTASETWEINVTAKASLQVVPDLFISEYAEGSSFNKYIEIYNPTDAAVDLSGYSLVLYQNGSSTASQTVVLSGSLAAGEVFVATTNRPSSETNQTILDAADLKNSDVCNWNGDDAVALLKGTEVLDLVGVIGEQPSSGGWKIGDTDSATKDHTIVRKADVVGPSSTFNGSEWNVLPKDDWTNIGQHTYSPAE